MVDVKPDEISAILGQQLSNFNNASELEVGTVGLGGRWYCLTSTD